MAALDFWYEFGSTYSYPAAMRIEGLADAAGILVRWRPFLLGPIFKALGWNDSPFNIYAAKGRYMWRDLARVCEAEGLALKLPPVRFPQNGLKGGAACAGRRDGRLDAVLHPRRVRRQLRRAEGYQRRRVARSDPRGSRSR
jgi:2-hydroxychromene-2-carboxylate isomerase